MDEMHHHDEHAEHHGSNFRLYWIVAAALGAATLIEVWLADFLPESLGWAPGPVAGVMLGIAVVKALLVMLFYMHLMWEKRSLWITVAVPLFLVALLALALFSGPIPGIPTS